MNLKEGMIVRIKVPLKEPWGNEMKYPWELRQEFKDGLVRIVNVKSDRIACHSVDNKGLPNSRVWHVLIGDIIEVGTQ